MAASFSVPLGVVVAREKVDHPWQDYAWRPLDVFLGAPPIDEWRELRRGPGFVHYHAATLTLELWRRETAAYQANMANGTPSVYVVLREDDEDPSFEGVEVVLVTASPFEAQAYGEAGADIIEPVAMPEPLVQVLEAFIAEHHVEEPFVKRARKKFHRREDHQFGQESLVELRRLQQRASQEGGSDG